MITYYPYYAVVWFGCASRSYTKWYYRNLENAVEDAAMMAAHNAITNVRVVGCQTRAQAIDADISDATLPVVHHV